MTRLEGKLLANMGVPFEREKGQFFQLTSARPSMDFRERILLTPCTSNWATRFSPRAPSPIPRGLKPSWPTSLCLREHLVHFIESYLIGLVARCRPSACQTLLTARVGRRGGAPGPAHARDEPAEGAVRAASTFRWEGRYSRWMNGTSNPSALLQLPWALPSSEAVSAGAPSHYFLCGCEEHRDGV